MMKPIRSGAAWLPIMAMALFALSMGAISQAQQSDEPTLSAADARGFLGEWVLKINSPRGEGTGALTIKDVEGKAVAEFTMREGRDPQKITQIKKVDGGLEMAYEANFQGQSFEMQIVVQRDGEGVKGTLGDLNGQFSMDFTGTNKTPAVAGDAPSRVRESDSSAGDATTPPRRRRRRGFNEAKIQFGEKEVSFRYGTVTTEDPGYAEVGAAKSGDVLRYTTGFAIKLKTDAALRFGDATIETENVAKDYPGVYGVWLKKVDGGWSLVFNERADVWGTQYDSVADVAEVAAKYSKNEDASQNLTVKIEERSDGGVLTLAWGEHLWTIEFDQVL